MSLMGLCWGNLRADFEEFLSVNGVNEGRDELKLRYNLYRERRSEMELHNSNPARTWNMALNRFSVMTRDERALYLGLSNETLARDLPGAMRFESDVRLGSPPAVDKRTYPPGCSKLGTRSCQRGQQGHLRMGGPLAPWYSQLERRF